ncbi:MAG: hypothetical protein K2N03_08435, partial [Muribaculaceae bacterium]|nr:hypothetical protein [Muribaculaceae bacterium]
ANEGMLCAKSDKPGPVHFNFRFSTPLGGIVKTYPESVRIIEEETTAPFMTKEAIYRLSSSAYDKRILIVAGFLPPSSNLQKSISSIMKLENVAVMAETISNLHLSGDNYSIDSTLCHLDKTTLESLRPDIVISLGGALVSRRLKEWLRSCPPDEHWVITQGEVLSDCFQSITKVIKTEPFAFIRQLAGSIKRLQSKQDKNSPSYSKIWQEIRRLCSELNRDFINNCGWSDLKAFSKIIPAIPTSWNLFISNGTSIRYDQIISHAPPHSTFCNRGVSGIDGSTSTAVGGSTAYKGMTLLITGDTSFAYDLGGLGCRLADKNFRLIVIRNGGGGIFRFISSTSSLPMREQCFCADPNPPCQGLANAYGWKYLSADSEASLSEALKLFLRNCESPILLEVFTPQEESAEILRQFFRNQRINPTSIFKHYYV